MIWALSGGRERWVVTLKGRATLSSGRKARHLARWGGLVKRQRWICGHSYHRDTILAAPMKRHLRKESLRKNRMWTPTALQGSNASVTGLPSKSAGSGTSSSHSAVAAVSKVFTAAVMA